MQNPLLAPAHMRGEMVAQARGQVMRYGLEGAAKRYGVDPRDLDVFINVRAGYGGLTRLNPTMNRVPNRKSKVASGAS